MDNKRRTFLKVLGASAAGAFASTPMLQALADPPNTAGQNEFFVFVHASGGWDVTMWADPRNQDLSADGRVTLEAATSTSVNAPALTRWPRDAAGNVRAAFEPVRPSGSNIAFGPSIGDLANFYSRLTVINGIAMNTVAHPDGTIFSATGRHLAGGRAVAASIDTMIASEFHRNAAGQDQLFPSISVGFPSHFQGPNLDREATPLRVGSIATVTRSLVRSNTYDTDADRAAVTAVLTDEARDLANRSYYRAPYDALAQQYGSLARMLSSDLLTAFSAEQLRARYTEFNYNDPIFGPQAINAAFAVEAMRRNVARCVSFALGGFDTHGTNYRDQGTRQQSMFNLLADVLRHLDTTPHPTLTGETLAAHAHVMVFSEFCRTPLINNGGGRDHYPNNSCLIISPKFRGNMVFGRTDAEQLLPVATRAFVDGMRPIAPPDVLATFLAAFGVDPRKYMRDGEVVRELLSA
jgi:uncharacterized protein (DUF1501 family)